MGIFSGGNSKRTTSNITDNRAVNHAQQAMLGNDNTLNITDGGAINLAEKVAKVGAEGHKELLAQTGKLAQGHANSLDTALKRFADQTELVGETVKEIFGDALGHIGTTEKRALDVVASATTNSSDKGLKAVQLAMLAVIGGAVILGVTAFVRAKK